MNTHEFGAACAPDFIYRHFLSAHPRNIYQKNGVFMRKAFYLAAAMCCVTATAGQAAEFVTNGDFDQTTNGIGQIGGQGQSTSAVDWSTNGYNFLFAGNTADTVGSNGNQYGNLQLWGPGNGSANGLKGSPSGGNYLAADGAFQVSPIIQTIRGLVVGTPYVLSFEWAAAQQAGFNGATTENFTASLGSESFTTATYNLPNHGFSGWLNQQFTFTPTSSTEVLSFLAHGTPGGEPPFSLLDGVSLQGAVPEPGVWAMLVCGFGIVGAALRRRAQPALASA
jgi:hypothetical protein